MDKPLKCVMRPTLKNMLLRRLAINLWDDSDILTAVSGLQPFAASSNIYERGNEWRRNVKKIFTEKVKDLNLPKTLKDQILDLLIPITYQLRNWEFWHEGCISSIHKKGPPHTPKISWTTAATINFQKTVEAILHCNRYSPVGRYKLVCEFCLEDKIPLIWEKLSDNNKYHYSTILRDECLELFWTRIITNEIFSLDYLWRDADDRRLTSINQWAFELAVDKANKTAAVYFFQKLTHEEREASVKRAALSVLHDLNRDGIERNWWKGKRSDVVCYLLSLMSSEDQMEILKAQPINVLLCFMDFPWHDLYLENASLIWTYLPSTTYNDLLEKMIRVFESVDFHFLESFQMFFTSSPGSFRTHFVEGPSSNGESHASRFFSVFFYSEDWECIKVIFTNVSEELRMKLVFDVGVLKVFHRYFDSRNVDDSRIHMVKLCLLEVTLSTEEKERLKDAYRNATGIEIDETRESVSKSYISFCNLLDEIYN